MPRQEALCSKRKQMCDEDGSQSPPINSTKLSLNNTGKLRVSFVVIISCMLRTLKRSEEFPGFQVSKLQILHVGYWQGAEGDFGRLRIEAPAQQPCAIDGSFTPPRLEVPGPHFTHFA